MNVKFKIKRHSIHWLLKEAKYTSVYYILKLYCLLWFVSWNLQLIRRKCMNKTVCNLQRENHFLNFSAWKDNEKAIKFVVATHTAACGMNVITVTLSCEEHSAHCTANWTYHTLGFIRQTRSCFSKKYISFHTPSMFLLSNLIYVEF